MAMELRHNNTDKKKQSRFQPIRPRHQRLSSTEFKPRTQPPINNMNTRLINNNIPTSSKHNYQTTQVQKGLRVLGLGPISGLFMMKTLTLYFRDLSQFGSGPLGDSLNSNEQKKTKKTYSLNSTDYMPIHAQSIMPLHCYKYYFRVDNEYILKKLSRILLPFLKLNIKQWKRKHINEHYQSPTYDINAPDGYLPLMAIVTYIFIMGFMIGYQSRDGFSPQILIATGSSVFVMLIIEVLLIKIGFYLVGNVVVAPYWLDIVCYSGCKLVFVTINLIIYLMFSSSILYYGISIGTGVIAALFMIQTLRPYFRDLNSNQPNKTMKIFLGLVGIAQILFIQFMGRYTTI